MPLYWVSLSESLSTEYCELGREERDVVLGDFEMEIEIHLRSVVFRWVYGDLMFFFGFVRGDPQWCSVELNWLEIVGL